ncbi:unnamed protein product [Ixodes hexagonus]
MYLGAKPTAELVSNLHGLDKSQVHNFRLRCLEFFIKAAHEIRGFPVKSDLMNLQVVDPKVVANKEVSSIVPLAISPTDCTSKRNQRLGQRMEATPEHGHEPTCKLG